MPTIVRKRGWSVRIHYSCKPGNFVGYSDKGPLAHIWFETRLASRQYCAQRKTHSKGAFPVRATLTLTVEDR